MENKQQNQKKKTNISLIILTYNEEVNIWHTLESVKDWVGEIIIVDSFSTDRTLEICNEYTGKIYQHPFKNQAMQFNWALDHVPISCEWVMRLDADEMVTSELAHELRDLFETGKGNTALADDITGIYLKRRVYFMGRWMKHGDYYPIWLLRIFRKAKGRYEEVTEEHIVLSEGRAIRLKNDFIDYNRKGLSFWTEKHTNWAIGEMYDTFALMEGKSLGNSTINPSLFSSQEKRRRWFKKNIYARFPLFLRTFLYFLYRYFLRLGFLDGIEGLIFHFLQGCWYRFYIDAKIYEAKKLGTQENQRIGSHGAGLYQAARISGKGVEGKQLTH